MASNEIFQQANTGPHKDANTAHRHRHMRDTRKQLFIEFVEKTKRKRGKISLWNRAQPQAKNVHRKTAALVHFNKYYFIIQRDQKHHIGLAYPDLHERKHPWWNEMLAKIHWLTANRESNKPNDRNTTSPVEFLYVYLFNFSVFDEFDFFNYNFNDRKSVCPMCVCVLYTTLAMTAVAKTALAWLPGCAKTEKNKILQTNWI